MSAPRIKLKRARKAAGYTQETFAYALGVDPRTVKRWENGLGSESSPSQRNCRAAGHKLERTRDAACRCGAGRV